MKAGQNAAGSIVFESVAEIMQTIWGDPEQFTKQYYAKYYKNPQSADWRD